MTILINIVVAIVAAAPWHPRRHDAAAPLGQRAKQIVLDAEREADDLKRDKELAGVREGSVSPAKREDCRTAHVEGAVGRGQDEAARAPAQPAAEREPAHAQRARRRAPNLDAQQAVLNSRQAQVDDLHRQAQDLLEHISGLSSAEAKEKLIESLKDEAKTAAASYINDIMDDAKLTANREAPHSGAQSIQRVATETAIENSVTVFHIDSDEIKGPHHRPRGRNIRAPRSRNGQEIIVDDTPGGNRPLGLTCAAR